MSGAMHESEVFLAQRPDAGLALLSLHGFAQAFNRIDPARRACAFAAFREIAQLDVSDAERDRLLHRVAWHCATTQEWLFQLAQVSAALWGKDGKGPPRARAAVLAEQRRRLVTLLRESCASPSAASGVQP